MYQCLNRMYTSNYELLYRYHPQNVRPIQPRSQWKRSIPSTFDLLQSVPELPLELHCRHRFQEAIARVDFRDWQYERRRRRLSPDLQSASHHELVEIEPSFPQYL